MGAVRLLLRSSRTYTYRRRKRLVGGAGLPRIQGRARSLSWAVVTSVVWVMWSRSPKGRPARAVLRKTRHQPSWRLSRQAPTGMSTGLRREVILEPRPGGHAVAGGGGHREFLAVADAQGAVDPGFLRSAGVADLVLDAVSVRVPAGRRGGSPAECVGADDRRAGGRADAELDDSRSVPSKSASVSACAASARPRPAESGAPGNGRPRFRRPRLVRGPRLVRRLYLQPPRRDQLDQANDPGAFGLGDPPLATVPAQILQALQLRAVEAVQPTAHRLLTAPHLVSDLRDQPPAPSSAPPHPSAPFWPTPTGGPPLARPRHGPAMPSAPAPEYPQPPRHRQLYPPKAESGTTGGMTHHHGTVLCGRLPRTSRPTGLDPLHTTDFQDRVSAPGSQRQPACGCRGNTTRSSPKGPVRGACPGSGARRTSPRAARRGCRTPAPYRPGTSGHERRSGSGPSDRGCVRRPGGGPRPAQGPY